MYNGQDTVPMIVLCKLHACESMIDLPMIVVSICMILLKNLEGDAWKQELGNPLPSRGDGPSERRPRVELPPPTEDEGPTYYRRLCCAHQVTGIWGKY